jgi:hypothetical protein
MAEEEEEHDLTSEYGEACLDSLRRSAAQRRRASLKAQVKEAERAGNLEEALRLAGQLQQLERAGGAQR